MQCRVALQILQVFNKKNPLIVGVKVAEGCLRLNTPLCIPSKDVCAHAF